ncbi:hypothetical protein, partial [Salmonella enterica]|uniref:hypothetical protein n=1 Tax=Salmonella enterica TaxID=28901 RepID=UPI0035234642
LLAAFPNKRVTHQDLPDITSPPYPDHSPAAIHHIEGGDKEEDQEQLNENSSVTENFDPVNKGDQVNEKKTVRFSKTKLPIDKLMDQSTKRYDFKRSKFKKYLNPGRRSP